MMNRIAPVVLLIAAVWSLWGIAKPKYALIEGLQADVTERRETLDKVEKIISFRNSLLAEYASVSEERAKQLGMLMPEQVDGIRLAIDIATRAENYGIKRKEMRVPGRTSVTPAAKRAAENAGTPPDVVLPAFEPFPIEFTLEGPYESFVAFLADIERSMRILDLDTLDIKVSMDDETDSDSAAPKSVKTPSASGGSDRVIYTYDLKFRTYQFME